MSVSETFQSLLSRTDSLLQHECVVGDKHATVELHDVKLRLQLWNSDISQGNDKVLKDIEAKYYSIAEALNSRFQNMALGLEAVEKSAAQREDLRYG